ncbi:SEC-C domain-containing protein [Oceanispirochaeta sp.]|jgi:hypothetical protein|uniref:SEC-C domain-containing protein n=1 Tax=Oceanispirochaeta sp. TaxID=2035350 RepID=UPI0026350B10|nr:SEC-C domain-containing protein [Oceanispirochaeta sp.]MDA3956542.1 SEC-C domain-containing protein [Oceanispirochaeta sp.]
MVARQKNNKDEQSLYEMNPYGMPRQKNSREDDHQAFIAIQVERYLKRKTQKRFCSEAEKDVILQIIGEYWKNISESPQVGHMDTDDKINTFYHQTLVFPYFVADEESLICIDFTKKRKLRSDDDCFCGSGRPYRECCGGINTLKDLLNGSF